MRKRIAVLFCLMLVSLFGGFVGCKNKDPYKDMTLTVQGIDNYDQVQELLIKRDPNTNSYILPAMELSVVVGNYDKADPDIIVSGWQGYIEEPRIDDHGNGKYVISSKVISYQSTGEFSLKIATVEGNKSRVLKYRVELQIESFSFASGKLDAVATGQEIVLEDIDGLISYFPEATTQKDLIYEIVSPEELASGDLEGHGRFDGYKYTIPDVFMGSEEYKYADIIKDATTGKHTLKVYSYFIKSNGEIMPVEFPKFVHSKEGDKENADSVITIRAKHPSNSIEHQVSDQYIDIVVVPSVGEVRLQMQNQDGSAWININKDKKGEFNVVLVGTNFDEGLENLNYIDYFSNRNIAFSVMGTIDSDDGVDKEQIWDYKVKDPSKEESETQENVYLDIMPQDKEAVSDMVNVFSVQGKKSGKYTHKFLLHHPDYPGVFDQDVIVNFEIIKIPTKIEVNDYTLSNTTGNEEFVSTIYDKYADTMVGSKFTVNTNSSFEYFLFVEEKEGSTDIVNNLQTINASDHADRNMAIVNIENAQIKSEKYSMFSSGKSFYLRYKEGAPLPKDSIVIYIGINFNVAHSSYSLNVKSQFNNLLLYFPLTLNIEYGIDEIKFAQPEGYNVLLDYTPDEYLWHGVTISEYETYHGIKLWTLPQGNNYEDSIKSITYDEEVFEVTHNTDENDETTIYFKLIQRGGSPDTYKFTVETYNGLNKSIDVNTHFDLELASPVRPIGITVDKSSPGYLYYMSGADDMDHQKQYEYMDIHYDSVNTLILTTNAKLKLSIYDFSSFLNGQIRHDEESLIGLLRYGSVDNPIREVDLSDYITVSFGDFGNYASFDKERGVLTTNDLITKDINTPIIMTITYQVAHWRSASIEEFEKTGECSVFNGYTQYTHEIELYIYEPLDGVVVTSSKNVDLYLDESLGALDTTYSRNTITSTYSPEEERLGSDWNAKFASMMNNNGAGATAVTGQRTTSNTAMATNIYYILDFDAPVLNKNGEQIQFRKEGAEPYRLTYKDILCEVDESNKVDGCITYECKYSDELLAYGIDKSIMYNTIFSQELVVYVYVYGTQFETLKNINAIKYTLRYAESVSGVELDVEDDGVYFEVWDNVDPTAVVINYTIKNPTAFNTNLKLLSEYGNNYEAKIEANPSGNGGKITITPRKLEVSDNYVPTDYITLTTEDNLTFDNQNNAGKFGSEYWLKKINSNTGSKLYFKFRVKVANGSKNAPYEIRTVDDYERMHKVTVVDKKNYHYVITRNINLRGYDSYGLTPTPNGTFSLSGKHVYERDDSTVTTYSKIYNMEINGSITDNLTINNMICYALFGAIYNYVILDNITITNAKIIVTDTRQASIKTETQTINVGLLAGFVRGATITNCSVSGEIKLYTNCDNNGNSSEIYNVGGMVGNLEEGTISGLPGGYMAGVVATCNNVDVDIEIAKTSSVNNNNTLASNIKVGGVAGVTDVTGSDSCSTITNIQVVDIITTQVKATIGGVVGYNDGALILDEIDVSPKIVAQLDSESKGNDSLIISNVLGKSGDTYSMTGIVVSYVDIGNDEDYTWEDRTNIFVNAPSEQVVVGGLVGEDNTSKTKNTIQYSYIRSYYVRKDFLGNIFVNANSGSTVGGLIGKYVGGETSVTSSYFDANIMVPSDADIAKPDNQLISNVGMLIGSIPPDNATTGTLKVENAYAIGNLKLFTIDQTNRTISVVSYDNAKPSMVGGAGSWGTASDKSDFYEYAELKQVTLTSVQFTNVYAITNSFSEFALSDSGTIYGVEDITTMLKGNNIYNFYKGLGYTITNDEKDTNIQNIAWFWHKDINQLRMANDVTYAFPVLLRNGVALYDVIPTAIKVEIVERDGLYNIYDTINQTTQVIMYLNINETSQQKNNYYEITVAEDSITGRESFFITLENTVVGSGSIISMNDKLEYIESTDGRVIRIEGNKIYPVSVGTAVLTIRSYVSKSVSANVRIVVVEGITDYLLYNDGKLVGRDTPEGSTIVGVSGDEEHQVVYIDEVHDIEIDPFNFLEYNMHTGIYSNTYYANKNIGFIIEILEAREHPILNPDTQEPVVDPVTQLPTYYDYNGKFRVNNKEYVYNPNPTNLSDNLINVNGRTFKISGVSLGNVRLKITPYINLPADISYTDTYKTANNELKEYNNIYILDGVGTIANLQSIYNFEVKSRALSIETTRKDVEIDSRNVVDFQIILETANVLFLSDSNEVKIREDISIIIGTKFNADFGLKNKIFEYKSGGTDIWKVTNFGEIEFDYTLINVVFNGLTIYKTNTDPQTRQNTYKLVFEGSIYFDRDHYRENANKYDLNSAKFDISFIPESNKELSTKIIAKIIPNEIEDIFTNFYSRGVEYSYEGDMDVEFPEDNESTFIVPGREGLLKITLDEEFNNNSYIELSISTDYLGIVSMEQIAAVVEGVADEATEVGEILGYRDVLSLEEFVRKDEFGIRLSKLSLNYKDINYFNNTYYVKLNVNKAIEATDKSGNPVVLKFMVTPYKINPDKTVSKQFEKPHVCELTVMELPYINVTIDNSSESIMGRGVKKELEIAYKGITNDIEVSISSSNLATLLNESNPNISEYLYIVDENNVWVNSLSIDYLNQKKKYYLCQDVSTPQGANFKLDFNSQELILGIIEDSKCTLVVDTVEFEIEKITVCGVDNGSTIQLFHGEARPLTVKITYRDIVVGDDDSIKAYKAKLESTDDELDGYSQYGYSRIQLIEYMLAGRELAKNGGDEELIVSGTLNLSRGTITGESEIEYDDITGEGVFGGVTIKENSIIDKKSYKTYKYDANNEIIKDTDGINIWFDVTQEVNNSYYELQGSTISENNYFSLDPKYYYDEKGNIQVSPDGDYGDPINFIINVVDNSVYDHPIPIETQDDLVAASKTTGHFILVNNIELIDWKPIEAKFDSLDGNGYSLKIISMDLSSFRGQNKADVGIFTKINENCLLKNIIVDVSDLLVSDTHVINEVNRLKASSKSTYKYNDKIDLAYIQEINFGILAGVNAGAITNAKVVAFGNETDNKYLHVQTSLSKVDGRLAVSNIGGLVGINESTGAVSNSFIGISAENGSSILTITSASEATMSNATDSLENTTIRPFVLAGGNNLGGLVCTNEGIISNAYAKGLGLYNTFSIVGDSATGGLVAYNKKLITSSFVEGNEIDEEGDPENNVLPTYRAKSNAYKVVSTGAIGGFVYQNDSTIENCYSNVYIEQKSSFAGGFVYVNNHSGTITNAYTTAVNRNSLALGQFTGVRDNVLQNSGTYKNCYYIVLKGEHENVAEDAVAVIQDSNTLNSASSWMGFSFSAGKNSDGIWTVDSKINRTPTIISTQQDTVSFRTLTEIKKVSNQDGGPESIYNYMYHSSYSLGSSINPLVIDKAENFDKYIIDSSIDDNGKRVFGGNYSGVGINDMSDSEYYTGLRYVRLVNNLNFEKIASFNKYRDTNLYKVVFDGVLDGNGMSIQNLNLQTNEGGLENFGLFAQIGDENTSATIKNISLTLGSYGAAGNLSAGILAGTIINSTIVNVNIDGGNWDVSGLNTAGAIAGVIRATDKGTVKLYDITVQNVAIRATYGSLGGVITSNSEIKDNNFTYFTIEVDNQQTEDGKAFKSLYVDGKTNFEELHKVSYAGGIAGVLVAENYGGDSGIAFGGANVDYRTKADESTISGLIVKGNLAINTADNSGGLFGYVGENTAIRDARLIVSDGQSIRASNNAGGIVGENHGLLEQVTVAYNEEDQNKFDDTILNDEAQNGTLNLFNKTDVDDYYTVSIGGIAGYSQDGVIVDSYVKANVVKELAFVAGGIVGYAKGNNYIGYTYNTGAVYGQYVVGGVVGFQLQVNNGSDKLYMNQVVSLTNWNASSGDLYIRNEVTKKLYNNYKFLYEGMGKDGEVANFHIKMPEIGNRPISVFNDDGTLARKYESSHDKYFIGSVIGKARSSSYSYSADQDEDFLYLLDKDDIFSYANVFSSTLGDVTSTGTVVEGSRRDDFFGKDSEFTVTIGEDVSIESMSYRVAYHKDCIDTKMCIIDHEHTCEFEGDNCSKALHTHCDPECTTNHTHCVEDCDIEEHAHVCVLSNVCSITYDQDLNHYEFNQDTANGYLDVFSFAQEFTSQEYRQQLLGGAYVATELSPDNKDIVVACKATRNIFKFGYNTYEEPAGSGIFYSNRTNAGDMGNIFIGTNEKIWTMGKYLPEYHGGTNGTIQYIRNSDELKNAFKTRTAGKTYIIRPSELTVNGTTQNEELFDPYVLSIDIADDETNIQYFAGIKSLFVGSKINEGTVDEQRPQIIINVNDGSTIASIFSLWNGAEFQDVDFVININNDRSSLNVSEENYGLLANTLEGAYINNCTFTINLINQMSVGTEIGKLFNAKNVGVVFGAVRNSNIENSTFNINVPNGVSISSVAVKNFGLFAGEISSSNIKNTTFTFNASNAITITNNVTGSINVGAVAGSVYTSKFTGINPITSTLTITDAVLSASSAVDRNIGTLFGYVNRLNYTGLSESGDDDTYYTLGLTYSTQEEDALTYVSNNIALVAGKSSVSLFNKIIIANNAISKIGVSTSYADTVSIGSIIGHDEGDSYIGRSGLVGSYANIEASVNSKVVNVGGLVGYTSKSSQLITNSFCDANVSLSNARVGYSNNEVYTFVGGMLGRADGSVALKDVLSAGELTLYRTNIANNSEDINYSTFAIGGLIGGAFESINVERFSVLNEISSNIDYYDLDSEDAGDGILAYSYFSGVLGYNRGSFLGKNGYSYVQLPTKSNSITSSITHGSINRSCENVYYCQEFIGNNYNSDIRFQSYAMGDLYGEISSFSQIYKLLNVMTKQKVGTIELPIVNSLINILNDRNTTPDTKFNPVVFTDSWSNDYKYTVITAKTLDNTSLGGSLEEGNIVSGRTFDGSKTTITLTYSDLKDVATFVGENKGILSNIYVNAGSDKTKLNNGGVNNVALVGKNAGLITNCYIYGFSYCNYSIAGENTGRIYASASSIVYYQPTKTDGIVKTYNELYGLVKTNSGVISDCYSTNYAYKLENNDITYIYGFAETNSGTIQYCNYYIPEEVRADNINKGAVKGKSEEIDGQKIITENETTSCYNSMAPSLINRSTIWENRDGYARLIGIEEPKGQMVIYVYISYTGDYDEDDVVDDVPHQITDVKDLRDRMQYCISNNIPYTLSYDVDSYVQAENIPPFRVVRISNSDSLKNYISSLSNGTIRNTIVILTNNSETGSSTIEIDPRDWSKIIVENSSAIIGIDTMYGKCLEKGEHTHECNYDPTYNTCNLHTHTCEFDSSGNCVISECSHECVYDDTQKACNLHTHTCEFDENGDCTLHVHYCEFNPETGLCSKEHEHTCTCSFDNNNNYGNICISFGEMIEVNGQMRPESTYYGSLIDRNKGIIAGVSFSNVNLQCNSGNGVGNTFATIQINEGIVDNVEIRNVRLFAEYVWCSAGLVGDNQGNAFITNCRINNLYIQSFRYANSVCTTYSVNSTIINNRLIGSFGYCGEGNRDGINTGQDYPNTTE